MPGHSQPGGFRIGKLFEAASGDLLSAIGYTPVIEGQEFECKYPRRHRRTVHEIDILAKFSTPDFLRPSKSLGDFVLVSCTTEYLSPQEIIEEMHQLSNSITCVRRYGFTVDCGVLLLNQTVTRPPRTRRRLFLWDERVASLYAYKAYIMDNMQRIPFPSRGTPGERQIDEYASFFWDPLKHEKKHYYTHNAVIFVEKPTALNQTEFEAYVSRIVATIRRSRKDRGTLYVSAHSVSGFTDHLRGNKAHTESRFSTDNLAVTVEGFHDHSLAMWWPVLKLTSPQVPSRGGVG